MKWLSVLWILVLGMAACSRGGGMATGPVAATLPGAETQPSRPRVVSTVPAATLNLVLIGGVDSLVGVSTYDVLFLPKDKQDLPVVGDYETMNYELLVKLHPTALVVQKSEARISPRLREIAAAHHFEIVNVKLDTVDDLWATVKELGRVSGREAAAQAAVMMAHAELDQIAAELKGQRRPKVLYLVGKNPLMVVGGDTFLDQVITLAGGENVGAQVGTGFPVIGNEGLVKLAPEVLLVNAADEPEQQQGHDPRVEPWLRFAMPAARDHRVWLVTDGNSLMASVDLPKGVRELAGMIHKGEVGAAAKPAGNGGGKP